MSGEQQYVDLIFRASKKFANWDPENHLEWTDVGHVPKCTRHEYPYEQGKTPGLAECSVKVGFQFVSGGGTAVLLMVNDSATTIDPATALSRLLGEEALRDCVVVSETHRCASYACYLTSSRTKDIAYRKWVRTNRTGYFKGKAHNSGERKYYPLYKLVSVRSDGGNTGRRSLENTVDGEAPSEVLSLPSALPPWMSSA
ncbi:hypothetical protein EDD16DRAFT_1638409 [Pisolithus croceorrhizus]|nr:hypothetical protein EDD16DRAFT_1638409 [Pisolithus croceorrhizus]